MSKNISAFSFYLNLGIFKLFSQAARDVLKHANKDYIKQCALANKCWLKQNWTCFFSAGLFRVFEMLIWAVNIKVWEVICSPNFFESNPFPGQPQVKAEEMCPTSFRKYCSEQFSLCYDKYIRIGQFYKYY